MQYLKLPGIASSNIAFTPRLQHSQLEKLTISAKNTIQQTRDMIANKSKVDEHDIKKYPVQIQQMIANKLNMRAS